MLHWKSNFCCNVEIIWINPLIIPCVEVSEAFLTKFKESIYLSVHAR